jgi:hypothetical protein
VATYCRGMTDEHGQHDRSGEVRASDLEREAVVERLRVATVEGRLTLAELTERTEAAYTATTRGDLVPITADLPTVPDSPATSMRPVAQSDREWVREAPAGRTAPKVVVSAAAVMGDVKILGDSYAQPIRRTLRAWLTRDDRDRRAIE